MCLPGRCRPGRRHGPCAAHRGPDHPLWRPDRAQQRQLRGPARRDPRHHRAERRGQEHLLQLPDRRAAPDLGPHPVQRRGHHRPAAQSDLAQGHRALLPDHQHPAERHGAGERAHRRAVAPARLEHAQALHRLPRHHRQGGSGAGVGRPARQGRRAGRQSVARRAAQSRDRHRACDRAAAALPRRADRRHERGRDRTTPWRWCAASPRT